MASTTTLTRKRQSFNPTPVVIQSTPVGVRSSFGGPGMSITRKSNVVSSSRGFGGGGMNRPHGEAGRLSKSTMDTLASTRGKEKKDLNELNAKLAGHLENTRYLEAQISSLTAEIERLKNSKGLTQDRVRDEYKDELRAAYDAMAEMKKQIAELKTQNLSLDDKLESTTDALHLRTKERDDFKLKLDKETFQAGEREGELAALRKMVENLEREKKMLSDDVERLNVDNDRIRNDCDAARLAQINALNELDALRAEYDFMCDSCEAENQELREFIEELRNVAPKIQDKWKSDFKEMIKVIQDDYNQRIAVMTDECRRKYEDELVMWKNSQPRDQTDHVAKSENKTLKSSLSQNKVKMSELERENARLLRELADLQRRFDEECAECEKEKNELKEQIDELSEDLAEVMETLNQIKDEKLSLELEIACYRKLLEGEECKMARTLEQRGNIQSQGGAALASMISGGGGGAQSSQSSTMSETSGSVKMQRTSKGQVQIKDVDQGGAYITISNSHRSRDIDISGWEIKRTYGGRDGKNKVSSYRFNAATVLTPGEERRVVAFNFDEVAKGKDLIAQKDNCKMWGFGNGDVTVSDSDQNVKATCSIMYQ
ncbi:hypothetical protein ACF0H5_022265 [Mactra antiquata]